MQDPHERHDHHPPRLIGLAAAAALLAAAPNAAAAAPRFWALPSPLAPLSASPPVGGGAASAAEGRPHQVAASTRVRLTVDAGGQPVAVTATQRLDVRRIGDYSFRVGAPVLDVRAAPGSATQPGLRTGAILWEGFNPGRRLLAAVLELDPAQVAGSLPLRIEVSGDRVTLTNVTAVSVSTFTADALAPQLRAYLAGLRAAAQGGELPTGGGALVTSALDHVSMQISAPLRVRGTVGARHVSFVLGGADAQRSVTLPRGPLRLEVTAEPPRELLAAPAGETGRALLARATRASLEFARAHQYDTFLGNPDVTGPSSTTYVYVSGRRASVATTPVSSASGHGWLRVVWIVALALAAAALAAVAWARS